MLKMMITDAVVSKGYNGDPAIRYFDVEGGGQIASFRIGKRLYDSKAPDNHRWLNFNVKASKNMCERIKRMKLKDFLTSLPTEVKLLFTGFLVI